MPYIQRDSNGTIIAIHKECQPNTRLSTTLDADVLEFILGPLSEGDKTVLELFESDLQFIRVLEDLIGILIEKNLVLYTDFPRASMAKMSLQKELRERIRKKLSGAALDSSGDECSSDIRFSL